MRVPEAASINQQQKTNTLATQERFNALNQLQENFAATRIEQPEVFTTTKIPLAAEKNSESLLNRFQNWFADLFAKRPTQNAPEGLTNERFALIEQYAESPFEKELLLLAEKQPIADTTQPDIDVTQRWANALSSSDSVERESAQSLFKQLLNYNKLDAEEPLSPHAQIKLMHFASKLQNGPDSLSKLYESVLNSRTQQAQDVLPYLTRDFRDLSVTSQLKIIQSLSQLIQNAPKDSTELKAYRGTLKQIVVNFYTNNNVLNETVMQELIKQQERIRLGFLRLSPIVEAHQSAVAETDLRYRVRLRQLKRQRQLLLKQADDDREQRINSTYDEIEKNLLSALSQWDPSLLEQSTETIEDKESVIAS